MRISTDTAWWAAEAKEQQEDSWAWFTNEEWNSFWEINWVSWNIYGSSLLASTSFSEGALVYNPTPRAGAWSLSPRSSRLWARLLAAFSWNFPILLERSGIMDFVLNHQTPWHLAEFRWRPCGWNHSGTVAEMYFIEIVESETHSAGSLAPLRLNYSFHRWDPRWESHLPKLVLLSLIYWIISWLTTECSNRHNFISFCRKQWPSVMGWCSIPVLLIIPTVPSQKDAP